MKKGVGLCLLLASMRAAALPHRVTTMVPMRDGVKLHTEVVVPKLVGTFASVIIRSPYGYDHMEKISEAYILFGMAAIGQDQRGTGKSEGNFTLFRRDADDGFDTLEWIIAQPWSNGKVFTFGASADGIASLMLIRDDPSPKNIGGQFFMVSSSDLYGDLFPGGAFRQSLGEGWVKQTVPIQAPGLIKELTTHESRGTWWQAIDLKGHYQDVAWPATFFGGWSDIFLHGLLEAFHGFSTLSQPAVRSQHRLIIDPLGHCQDAASFYPDHLSEGRSLIPLAVHLEQWGLLPADPKTGVKTVTFYVMSNKNSSVGNYWTTLDAFPTPQPLPLYLAADQQLLPTPPPATNTENDTSTYVSDPSHPIPTIGGNNLMIACGPLNQAPLESRKDVLVFTGPVLESPLTITGPITATLFVSSDAKDSDFMVKLIDYNPATQESRLIQDGAARMRWRLGGAEPAWMEAGEVYEVEVVLGNTSYVFDKGHAVRVHVQSSNFPRQSLNLNNGALLAEGGPNVTATNVIYHSSQYPSRVTLPVVSLKDLKPYRTVDLLESINDRLSNKKLNPFGVTVDLLVLALDEVIRGILDKLKH